MAFLAPLAAPVAGSALVAGMTWEVFFDADNALTAEIRANEALLEQLRACKATVLQVREAVSRWLTIDGIARDSANMFRARIHECPRLSVVAVGSRDWAGVSAVAFLEKQTARSQKMMAGADTSEGLLKPLVDQIVASEQSLQQAQPKIEEMLGAIAAEIKTCKSNIANARAKRNTFMNMGIGPHVF